MSSLRRLPPIIDGMVSLKVDNITFRTTIEDLQRVFERYGEIGDIYIPLDRFTKKRRGFAFVRFRNRRDAEYAIEIMNDRVVDGRRLHVQMARYGRPTGPPTPRNGGDDRSDRRSRSRGRRLSSRSRSRSRGRRLSSRSRCISPVHKKASVGGSRSKGRKVSRSTSDSNSD